MRRSSGIFDFLCFHGPGVRRARRPRTGSRKATDGAGRSGYVDRPHPIARRLSAPSTAQASRMHGRPHPQLITPSTRQRQRLGRCSRRGVPAAHVAAYCGRLIRVVLIGGHVHKETISAPRPGRLSTGWNCALSASHQLGRLCHQGHRGSMPPPHQRPARHRQGEMGPERSRNRPHPARGHQHGHLEEYWRFHRAREHQRLYPDTKQGQYALGA